MSKGKQWWPLQASVDDSKKALMEFQDRLRERQWLKKSERSLLMHIYAKDTLWPADHLPSVNDYMQISNSDSAAKNQARVSVSRLLAMLVKWHAALRPFDSLMAPPVVFSTPNLSNTSFHYGLIATIQASTHKPGSKPLTLIVSETELASEAAGVRHFAMAQGEDSYRWVTPKTWSDQRQKPSFGKWVYGSYTERRTWAEGLDSGAFQERGLFAWSIDVEQDPSKDAKIAAIKQMGALFSPSKKVWLLPDFWDRQAVDDYLSSLKNMLPSTRLAARPNYRSAIDHHKQASTMAPEWVPGSDTHDPDEGTLA